MMPDFLICLECESPVYVFEWQEDRLVEAICLACGNEDPSQFATESELEDMSSDRSLGLDRRLSRPRCDPPFVDGIGDRQLAGTRVDRVTGHVPS